MPPFIDALCYLFPWKRWIIRPLIIARSTLSHKTTSCQQACLALCQPGTNFDFVQITELSGSCWYEPRFAHFSAFRRKPCISLRLRSPSDENWSVTHLFLCMTTMLTYFGSSGPSTTCGKPALRASGLRGESSPALSCCSKPSSTSQETSADLISRYCCCCCCASTLSIRLKNSLKKESMLCSQQA